MEPKSSKNEAAPGLVDVSITQEAEAAAATGGPPHVTPLPRKQMTVLAVVLMTESVCGTMLLPFVPRLIAYLKHITVEEAGYYTGILVGLFMLGQVVSSKLWGYMSDTYGRKVPLTTGLLAGAFAMLFFGYTRSFIVCCVLRFLHGFFNGNTLVAKTMIADITDRTNEAQGFALVSITWGVGTLFGPFIGGFLYNPSAKSYLQWLAGGSLRSFFEAHTAFLPSFTIFLYTMVALLLCVFLLRETNMRRKHFNDTKLGRWVNTARSVSGADATAVAAENVVVLTEDQTAPGVDAKKPSNIDSLHDQGDGAAAAMTAPIRNEVGDVAAPVPVPAPPPVLRHKLSYMQAMRIGALRNVTVFYMLLSASDMTYGEILPLWGNAESGVGGMGLTENAVATLMLSYSIPSIIANLHFHRVCRFFRNEYIIFWRYSLAVYTIATLIIPGGSKMGGGGYYYVMFLGMARQVGLSWCYSLIHMLTAKAAPLGCVGAAYGISQSCAAATRCAVPFIVAPLFAWTLREGRTFPFDYYLVFLISAIPAATSVLMSFYVQITRGEACVLDFEDVEASENDLYDPRDPHDRGSTAGDHDGDSSGNEDRGSMYMSSVSSFCTNPLHDTYVNMSELERTNAEVVQDMMRHHQSADVSAHLCEREIGSGVLAMEGRRRGPLKEEYFLPVPHTEQPN